MTRDKKFAKGRTRTPRTTTSGPVRVSPADDPAEAVERLLSRRQLIVEEGDIMVVREAASIGRGGPLVPSLTTPASSQYRVTIRGQKEDSRRVFAMYDRAVADGEGLAAERRVRLFYIEDGAFTLLKDYRPAVT